VNADRPNILIFCTDEQRGDYLGCMGHPVLKTPNIDRIAAGGTLFRNCYCSSPVCMPARATMFTGLTNRASGVYANGIALDESVPTLPRLLAAANYRTHSVGKLHLKPWGGRTIAEDEDTTKNPERRIYWKWPGHWEGGTYTKSPDHYYGFQTQDSVGGHVNYAFGDYVTWLEANHPGAYAGYRYSGKDPGPLTIPPELHYNNWIADRSIEFIRKVAQPFFLWCSFPDPHEPFAAVEKWSDFYADAEIELPRSTLELSPHNRSETMNRLGLGTSVQDPAYVRKCVRQTYGMISHIDEQAGRVLDALEELGIAGNTVVMFISDHGDQMGEHGLFYKGIYPFDGHAHIPFVAKVPWATEKGKVVDDVVSQLDLVPTVLDLAGVKHPDDLLRLAQCGDKAATPGPSLPGEVLTPVVTGRASPMRRNALIELDRISITFDTVQMRVLVTNDYKLVYYAGLRETMLFDRKRDPLELRNLAGDAAYQPLVEEMLKHLLAELSRTEMRAPRQCSGA
jgi:arylsulfatase A-like enzyme